MICEYACEESEKIAIETLAQSVSQSHLLHTNTHTQYYLVLAEPHIGLCKLLHVPSSDRYGDLIQRCGGMAQRSPGDACFEYDGPPIKLLKRMKPCIEGDKLKIEIESE